MKDTRIRWAEHTWNPTSGCDKISPGCDNCYAETLTMRFGPNSTAFPNGFTPTYKPKKLGEPSKFLRSSGPGRIFVNSMSDLFHTDFTDEQRDSIFDVMRNVWDHDYLVLTKRPNIMRAYFNGTPDGPGYLERKGLTVVPGNIWLGTSIENDRYTFRTKDLIAIPALVHFLSVEPMLGPVPSLSLLGIQWVICGGESGPGFRPMDHDWARDLRDRCRSLEIAFYFKQSAAIRTEMGMELDGELIEEYPLQHPADREGKIEVGRWIGRHAKVTVTPVGLF